MRGQVFFGVVMGAVTAGAVKPASVVWSRPDGDVGPGGERIGPALWVGGASSGTCREYARAIMMSCCCCRGSFSGIVGLSVHSSQHYFLTFLPSTQGAIGDCWLIAAMSLVATRDDALAALFCGMSRTGPCARGVYVLRFYKGRVQCCMVPDVHSLTVLSGASWHYVIIDDRLPRSASGAVLYAKSKQNEEWWVSFLEKAYAKLHGSYDSLIGERSSYNASCRTVIFAQAGTPTPL